MIRTILEELAALASLTAFGTAIMQLDLILQWVLQ